MNVPSPAGWCLLILLGTLSAQPSQGENTFAIFFSTDRGRSWSNSTLQSNAIPRVNAFVRAGNSVIAGSDAGILISNDAAKTWRSATIAGGDMPRVSSLAAIDDFVFAGTSEGLLFVSSDQGARWKKNPSFPLESIRSLHALGGSLYVGTDDGRVYLSSDKGEKWTDLSAGLPRPSQVFALTSIAQNLFAGLYARGLYTWNAQERKWLRIGTSANIRPLALAATSRALIAGHNPGGIYWSVDLGRNWTRWTEAKPAAPERSAVNPFPFPNPISSIPETWSPDLPIWEMAADSDLTIAGVGGGIYRSTDHGQTWRRADIGLPAAPGIAFLVEPGLAIAAISEMK